MRTEPAAQKYRVDLLRLLVVVAVVEIIFTAVRRFQDAGPLLRGETSTEAVTGALGLLWLPVVAVVLGLSVRKLRQLTVHQALDTQSIAAAATTSQEWMWQSSPDLVLTYSNDRVQDLLGYSAEELVGRPMSDLLAPGEQARVGTVVSQALRTGTGWQDLDTRWRHREGYLVTMRGSASCILDRKGGVQALWGSRRPVNVTATVRRQATTARRQVRAVLSDRSLQMATQPIIDLDTSHLAGVEALARFTDGRRPDLWFTQAAAVGLGADLELLAVECAPPLMAELPEDACLSVNASPEAIVDTRLALMLTAPGIHLDRIVLEVTEHVEIDCYTELIEALTPLCAKGLGLAVDDAGAGYASFQHVLQLRPDIIKLDRALISGVDTDAARRSLVTAIILLALGLDTTVTAEGVETAAELDTLVSLGVDHAQGYPLGRPTLQSPSDWARRVPTRALPGEPRSAR